MVKGISRQVIVVKSPDPEIFEQAIFLLRPDAQEKGGVSQDALFKQAQAAARGYNAAHIPKAGRLWAKLFWALTGAGAVGLLWALSALAV